MASSPLPGWLTSSVSRSTPSFLAQLGSRACSASMKAAMPPAFWARAMTCKASVVLPLDSGPKISTIRPLGMPCPPRAMSSDRLPVGMPSIWMAVPMPRGMMAPSPNCFSIWASVFFRSGFELIADSTSLGLRAVLGGISLAMRLFDLVAVTIGKPSFSLTNPRAACRGPDTGEAITAAALVNACTYYRRPPNSTRAFGEKTPSPAVLAQAGSS